MFKIVLELVYITSFLKYILFFRGILGENIKRYYIGIAGCFVWLVFMYIPFVMNTIPIMISTIVLWFSMFFMIEGKWYKKCIMLFLTETMLNTIQEIISFVVKYLFYVSFSVKGNLYIFSNILIIFGLGIWLFFARKRKETKRRQVSALLVYGSICLLIFTMSLSATFLPVISGYVTEEWVINTAKVMELLVLFSILLISVLVYHVYSTNERLKNAYDVEKNLKQTQAVYYETLLRKEQETRSFRHDLSGQFVYISSLAKQAQAQDIIDYMKKMTDSLEKISKIGFHTGNLILDTMLSYYTADLGRDVSVKVTGMLDYELAADEMQLCTIFSNVLKNVSEELHGIKEEQKHLHVFLRCGSENAVIQMENTSRPKKMEGDNFLTSKKDKKNHGIGIQNIKKTVDMCGGFCNFSYKNGEFITEIYIPLKNDL